MKSPTSPEDDLRRAEGQLRRVQEELRWKTAFLEAQANSSIDAIIVVDQRGKKILQNHRVAELFHIPRHIADDPDDGKQVIWVTNLIKDPGPFAEKIGYLYSHPEETSRDEIELKDGTLLDRYSAPVLGKNAECYGRIWTFRDITEQHRLARELKQAKVAAAVREGEQRYIFLADTVPLIIWTARPDGCLDYYNKAWFDYTGLNLAQTQDWGWGAVIHPDDLQRCIERWTHSFSTGENYEIEYRFKRGTDGAYRWFLGRAAAHRNEAGEIVQWVGTCTDIDDKKRVESEQRNAFSQSESMVASRTAELATANAALRQENAERKRSEESLRLLGSAVEQSKDSVVITDAQLDMPGPNIIFVNPAFTKMTGYSAEEAMGKTPRILQGPRTDKTVLARLRQNLERGEVFEGEAINYRKDGTEFYLEWQIAPLRDASGKTTHFVAIQHDITERKRIESRFRRLMDSNAQGVIFWNKQGEVTEANDAYLRLVGYTREDLQARRINWAAMTPPEFAHLDRHALKEIAATGTSSSYEKEYIRKDGSRVPVLLGAAAFQDNPDEGVCFFVDLTARKRLEAQLFQSQKMETIGKLAGGVAHEFNSIMTAIIGQSELLLHDLVPGNPLAKSATEIHKAAERAATLTRQLLAYGRKQVLQPKALDLNAILAGMEGTLRHLMVGTEVRIIPGIGLKALVADAGQIEQVIMNLAINAAESMPDGGSLMLETANVTFDEQSVQRYPELKPGNYVMLAVTDSGVGMSEAVKQRAFEPFFTTKPVGEGTGLGLSTCYGIIKQSGGHISVYSEIARGTTFKIYLPQVEQEAKVPQQRQDAPELPRGTETVLLVEDDPALREMAAMLLRRLGYTVLTAANGIEALNLKKQRDMGHIDLLFTDVVMPHMSGRELADRVRALYPHTRILFTSAYTENAIVHQGVLAEGVALLQKPFTPSALARKVREVLDLSYIIPPDATQRSFGFTEIMHKAKTP